MSDADRWPRLMASSARTRVSARPASASAETDLRAQRLAEEQLWWDAARADDDDHAREAFSQLYRRYRPPLVQFASTIKPDAAVDIVQTVFANVWLTRKTTRLRGSIHLYLYGAVRNRAHTELRAEGVAVRHTTNVVATGNWFALGTQVGLPDEVLERREFNHRIARAIDRLSPREREVLLLRCQELSYADIASQLATSTKNVEVALHRAFKHLRSLCSALHINRVE